MRGRFISFEGIEGVGKTTNIQWAESYLKARGIQVLRTREPGGTEVAELLRAILLTPRDEKIVPKTELLLLYAGRVQHIVEVIEPALKEGTWVLCDRFSDATFAYQGGGRQVPLSDIEVIHDWALKGFKPDHTILLDGSVALSRDRLQNRNKDRIENEKEAFFERVRHLYLQLAKKEPERFLVLEASQPLESVQAEIGRHLDEWLTQ